MINILSNKQLLEEIDRIIDSQLTYKRKHRNYWNFALGLELFKRKYFDIWILLCQTLNVCVFCHGICRLKFTYEHSGFITLNFETNEMIITSKKHGEYLGEETMKFNDLVLTENISKVNSFYD